MILLSIVSASKAQDAFLDIVVKEMERQKEEFSKLDPSPYYFSFKIDEVHTDEIQADFGGIIVSDSNFGRIGNIEVRIGDYEKDNTVVSNGYGYQMQQAPIPIDDEERGVNFMLWIISDLKYKMAQAGYNSITSAQNSRVDKSASFSRETPSVYFEEKPKKDDYQFDKERWESMLKKVSGMANNEPNITLSSASMSKRLVRKYFIDSEGSSVVQNQRNCLVSLNLTVVDKTGNQIPVSKTFSKIDLKELPEEEELSKEMSELIKIAKKMIDAPYVEPYSGPVLFSGEASAVFFHEVLGHRIEAQRLTEITDGQTFVNKLDTRILPKDITIKSLPTIDQYNETQLTGGYIYDDQGVKSQDVVVVEDGVLKKFLMSRKPTKAFSQSNGHGRASDGGSPVSRQSNLIIESSKGYSNEKLKEMLIKECKKQKKAFGYFIDQVDGGYTTTDRYQPNTINISPIVVYKVYVDGRDDELVKGMNLIGTPLNVFSEIMGAGNEHEVFNGYCGAESGYIPVSAVSPALLLKKMEVQRKPIFKTKLPILPPPTN